MVDQTAIKLGLIFPLAFTVFVGCAVHRSIEASRGMTAAANGLVARIDSISCCTQWQRSRIIEFMISIRNDGNRAIIISPHDILLLDAEGYRTAPGSDQLYTGHLQRLWLFKPSELIEFEQRWETRFREETVLAPGSAVTVRVFFPERVDFDNLSAIRIRSPVGGIMVEIPL